MSDPDVRRSYWLAESMRAPWARDGRFIYRLTSRGRGGVNIFSIQINRDNGTLEPEEVEQLAAFVQAAPETAAERDHLLAVNRDLLAALRRVLGDLNDAGRLFGPDIAAELFAEMQGAVLQANDAVRAAEAPTTTPPAAEAAK